MSRIGKNPVELPDGVSVVISGQQITTKGKLGELSAVFTDDVDITEADSVVTVKPRSDSIMARKMWGTSRSVISNMVHGVSQGFTRNLVINGVGYRAAVQGSTLVLQLGFSHEVKYPIPSDIKINCPDQTHITIQGIDKQRVGQTAANIRAYRPPEPYKGKGIKYEDEYVLRKEGKKK
mgnify:CR=1 FL=1|jgi:large subunit ribosomal protein L6